MGQPFGEGVFDVMEREPRRLREVTGIGPKRAERIVAGGADQKAIREVMLFLHGHGVGTSRAVRIFKTYDAIQLISENPCRLARDIRGIGFKSADQIAQRLGIEPTTMIRARAGIGYALAEAMAERHCGLPLEELVPLAEQLLEIPGETDMRRSPPSLRTVLASCGGASKAGASAEGSMTVERRATIYAPCCSMSTAPAGRHHVLARLG